MKNPVSSPASVPQQTHAQWLKEGNDLFGPNFMNWKFKCVHCGTSQSARDFIAAGLLKEEIESYLGFSCIGRFDNSKGCDWTLGGLFQIHTLEVIFPDSDAGIPIFEFAKVKP